MSFDRLKLNPTKTELMRCVAAHQRQYADYVTPFVLDGVSIAPIKTVKLLGVYIDGDLSMSTHVSRTVSTCFYQLRRIKAVRRSLPIEAAKTVINAFIMSRVDYCNGLLPGITQRQRDRMQSIFNASARLL